MPPDTLYRLTRLLRDNAELITTLCVALSLVLSAVLYGLTRTPDEASVRLHATPSPARTQAPQASAESEEVSQAQLVQSEASTVAQPQHESQ